MARSSRRAIEHRGMLAGRPNVARCQRQTEGSEEWIGMTSDSILRLLRFWRLHNIGKQAIDELFEERRA